MVFKLEGFITTRRLDNQTTKGLEVFEKCLETSRVRVTLLCLRYFVKKVLYWGRRKELGGPLKHGSSPALRLNNNGKLPSRA